MVGKVYLLAYQDMTLQELLRPCPFHVFVVFPSLPVILAGRPALATISGQKWLKFCRLYIVGSNCFTACDTLGGGRAGV